MISHSPGAHWRRVQLDFIHPGNPVENAYIESFNRRFRTECLNAHWFHSINEARLAIKSWRKPGRRVDALPEVLLVDKDGVRLAANLYIPIGGKPGESCCSMRTRSRAA